MGYGIYRIEKRTKNAVGGIKKENNRSKEEMEKYLEKNPGKIYLPNSDVEWDKTKDNIYLKKDDNWYQTIKKEIDKLELKKAPRKDAIVLLDHFVGISPEEADKMDEKALISYFKDSYKAIEGRYGHVVNAVIHLDEKTPHMHITTVPITKDGRLSAKELTSGSMSFRQTQEWFYSEVARKYKLKRGEPKSKTDREHLTKQQFELEKLLLDQKELRRESTVIKDRIVELQITEGELKNSIKGLETDKDKLQQEVEQLKKELYGDISSPEGLIKTVGLVEQVETLKKEKKSLEGQIQAILDKASDMFSKAIDFFFKRDFELADKWVDLTVEQTHKSTESKLNEPYKTEVNKKVEDAAEGIQVQFRKRKSR